MQFESFDRFSHPGLCAIIPCSTNVVSVCGFFRAFLVFFLFSF